MRGTYYLCTLPKYKAVAGPFQTWGEVVRLVDSQKEPTRFCLMSRYMLAKEKVYPRTKAGDAKLEADIKDGVR